MPTVTFTAVPGGPSRNRIGATSLASTENSAVRTSWLAPRSKNLPDSTHALGGQRTCAKLLGAKNRFS